MWTSLQLATAFFALAAGVCRNSQKGYYEELGCTPAELGVDGCPKSYDCSKLKTRDTSKCYYKGQGYEKGSGDLKQFDDHCIAVCRCDESYYSKGTSFNCVSIECPELFHGPPPPGCYRTYSHDKCCSVGQVCPSDETPEQKATKAVCQYKSQQYQLGQKFWPDEEPCLECICQEGFTGALVEPFCKKIKCSLELHYGREIADGCIPVYFREDGCCPIEWRCPDKSDSAVSVSSEKDDSRNNESGPHCKFGDVIMKIGDKLSPSKSQPDTECTCRVPPHPVCVKKG